MSTMDDNARSVVAAWRATNTTVFTNHLADASPSAITTYVADIYMDIAIHVQHVTTRLLADGFPPQHSIIKYLNVLFDTTTAYARQSTSWQQALAKAEAELP